MGNGFVILVADRNRHVREFLRRELAAEGYAVEVARDGREVLMMVHGRHALDLLVLDLELPYMDGPELLRKLEDSEKPVPVIIHAFIAEAANLIRDYSSVAAVVEKSENTDRLKATVLDALKKFYPERFPTEHSGQG